LEVIPRWQALESQPQFESWPVLVNARMPSQHYEILSLLIGEQRQVVRAEINQRLELKQAVLLADVQHIAFEPRPGQQLREDDVQYSDEAIEYLRRCFLPPELPLAERRIYLSRRSSMLKKRQILNAEAVEATFSAMGFEVVDTAELSFQQQVELFASASIIAGASGASFSNMVFAQSVAKVLMIISPLHNMGLYFRNLAAACGIDDYQEFEAIHVVDTDTFHSDYRVDIEALTQTLEGMLA
jgi:capsular polysaccharide biosynthesis protein